MSLEVQPISLKDEYAKHKNIRPKDIKQLREWLKTQPHLPEEHLTDLDLILTYFCCDTSDLYSKQVLDLHFTLRTLYYKFSKDRYVDDTVVETFQNIIFLPISDSKDGVRYMFCALRTSDPKCYDLVNSARAMIMTLDLWQYEDGTWPGFSLIIDLQMAVVGHLAKLEIWALKQIIFFVQECMLLKLKSIIFINAPSFMGKIMMLIKPLTSNELFSKIQIYDSKADLTKTDIPIHAFPKDNGGNALSREELCEQIVKKLQSNKEFFIKENFKRVNESLRPFKSPVVEEAMGVGSFKKLDID